MGMVQIVTAAGLVNAEIVKSFLESCSIHTTYGPLSFGNNGSGGPNMSQTIFVPEDKAEEALKLLKEQKLIN